MSVGAAGRRRRGRRRRCERTSEKPFAWIPADGSPTHDVARARLGSRRSERRARRARRTVPQKSISSLPVDARQLRGLAAQDRAAGGAAHLGCALDELDHLLGIDGAGRDVIEEEEGLGAGRQHVVDAVRGEVGAAPRGACRPAARGRASSPPSRWMRRAAGARRSRRARRTRRGFHAPRPSGSSPRPLATDPRPPRRSRARPPRRRTSGRPETRCERSRPSGEDVRDAVPRTGDASRPALGREYTHAPGCWDAV